MGVARFISFAPNDYNKIQNLAQFPSNAFHFSWNVNHALNSRNKTWSFMSQDSRISRLHCSTLKGEIYDSQIHTLKTKNIVYFVHVVAQHWTIMGSQVPTTRIPMPNLASSLMSYLKILLLDCKSQMECNNGGWNLDFKWKTNWWTLHFERIENDVALLQAC